LPVVLESCRVENYQSACCCQTFATVNIRSSTFAQNDFMVCQTFTSSHCMQVQYRQSFVILVLVLRLFKLHHIFHQLSTRTVCTCLFRLLASKSLKILNSKLKFKNNLIILIIHFLILKFIFSSDSRKKLKNKKIYKYSRQELDKCVSNFESKCRSTRFESHGLRCCENDYRTEMCVIENVTVRGWFPKKYYQRVVCLLPSRSYLLTITSPLTR
jgi:hypothetical protein